MGSEKKSMWYKIKVYSNFFICRKKNSQKTKTKRETLAQEPIVNISVQNFNGKSYKSTRFFFVQHIKILVRGWWNKKRTQTHKMRCKVTTNKNNMNKKIFSYFPEEEKKKTFEWSRILFACLPYILKVTFFAISFKC